ncbi:uncharacterized protein JCM10292_002483 [Rhodotorula paludigena]|uniref:uncharacterized protein n=1 Tax=Rhodotorula paludigena TaxID=86838 RepID=UPI00316BF585
MNKLKQVFSHEDKDKHENPTHSSSDVTQTPAESSSGDRLTSAAVDLDNDRSRTAKGDRTLSRGSSRSSSRERKPTGTGAEGSVARGVEHLREQAAPPAHRHDQPKKDGLLSEADAKLATHDHQHLAPVTHEVHHHHEIEEVERQREVDRHVHHVQHHVQPVVDVQHAAEQQHEKAVPVTKIKERHVATDEDKAQFATLNTAKDSLVEAPRERTIIDKGEQVRENVSHHVHHIVQPEIERDTHEHHRIHTTIPVHQTTHEAPIVHASVQHEPLSLKDFVAGGGDLKSTLKHDAEKLLNRGECERTVDGPAETLVDQMGLASINDKMPMTTGPTGTNSSVTGTTAATGTGMTPASNVARV